MMLLCGVPSACVRLLTADIMIWSLVAASIWGLVGNHFTVSHVKVDDVTGVQIF